MKRFSTLLRRVVAILLSGIVVSPAYALDVNIANMVPYVDIKVDGENVRIQRIQDEDHVITGGFAKTSRPCPPFCFQPMTAGPNVRTVGEVEIVRFLTGSYRSSRGLLIDARTEEWFERGTIPGSINVPFTVFDEEDLEGIKRDIEQGNESQLLKAFKRFGVQQRGNVEKSFISSLFGDDSNENELWDFTNAKELVLFCNGPWCGQSPRAIRGLLKLGYPANKLFYYRGGMQMWQMGGFTTIVPKG
jgi:rhodanese-related sulfurtransferase